MTTFRLKSSQFRAEREESWKELEGLIAHVERHGLKGLDAAALNRLPALYRSTVSSLSVARAISLDKNLLEYLENLSGRAYLVVYGAKRRFSTAVLDFVLDRFPSTVRRYWGYLLAAAAVLGIGIASGYLLTQADVERFYSLVPDAVAGGRTPASTNDELREVLYHVPEEGLLQSLQLFASFLFSHNAKIGILAFALGFAAGAPAVFLLFYNGLMLGAMAALYSSRAMGLEFWAWVLPHGVTELGAVCLCGMAGLVLGSAVVFPGRSSRLENLARRGREIAMVVIGTIGLFFVAALIEGFFRQLVHDVAVRWTVAFATLVSWSIYFVWMGRNRAR